MTTIAWDGKTLAVDSQVTKGETITSINTKKLFLDVGPFKAVAFTGTNQDIKSVLDWIESGDKNQLKFDEFFIILAIDHKGKCQRMNKAEIGEFTLEGGVVTEGCGGDIALGAMDAGATAVEAVKIACKRDIYTGGRVRSYTFEKDS